MTWQQIAYLLIGLLIGVVFHEYMHGRFAEWLGDGTPRRAGRLTLNPVPHMDLFGTIILPLALALLLKATGQGFIFGYAKPVPVNPYFLKKPRRDMMLVALAGPLTNFFIAILITLIAFILRVSFHLQFAVSSTSTLVSSNGDAWAGVYSLLIMIAVINIVLGFFNLIPVPPLDGSHILEYFLSPRAQQAYESVARYGFVILFLFIWLLGGIFFRWMDPIFRLIEEIALGTVTRVVL